MCFYYVVLCSQFFTNEGFLNNQIKTTGTEYGFICFPMKITHQKNHFIREEYLRNRFLCPVLLLINT